LARNLAAIRASKQEGVPVIADFSLNVANHRAAEWIRSVGAERVTVSYDLNREQVSALCDSMPTSWMEVVIHQHMPMFHMEHCVFCSVLSPGTNKTNCGRPCDHHEVKLRDRVGAEHPLHADVACRNTLYNSIPQSGAEITTDLLHRGVKWFRVELLDENLRDARATVDLYQRLLEGAVDPQEVWSQLKAANRLGVTRGTLEAKRNPLAIL
jgi:putative protease